MIEYGYSISVEIHTSIALLISLAQSKSQEAAMRGWLNAVSKQPTMLRETDTLIDMFV